jgi:hypothetical protein
MRALAAVLLLILLALSGCATKSGATASFTQAQTGLATKAATGTAAPAKTATATGAPAAGAPTADNATATPGAANSTASNAPTATLALLNATGAVPFNATFQAGGSADGNLTFTLSFGDGSADATGSSLPASIVHAYTLTGNFTAHLTVSAGTQSANATALVHATKAAGSAGFAPIHEELAVAVYCEACSDMVGNPAANTVFCASFQAGVPGVDCAWVELPAGSAGHEFSATSDALLGAIVEVAFTADCSGTSEIVEYVPGSSDPTTGVVPAEAGCMVLWDYDGPANITIKLDIV